MTTATTPRIRHIEGVVPERTVLGVTLAAIGAIVLTGFIVPDLERSTLLAISAVLLCYGVRLRRNLGSRSRGAAANGPCLDAGSGADPRPPRVRIRGSSAGCHRMDPGRGRTGAGPRRDRHGPPSPRPITLVQAA